MRIGAKMPPASKTRNKRCELPTRFVRRLSFTSGSSSSFQTIIFLLTIAVSSRCHAGEASAISAIGIGVKFNQNEWKLYTEVSYWPDYLVGIAGFDAGFEMGNKSMDIYAEGQMGIWGLGGYSHGAYYRVPYHTKNCAGFRGKVWAGAFGYIALDVDYTQDERMFGVFVKKPYEYRDGGWAPLSFAW
jgi:hypothetical protein